MDPEEIPKEKPFKRKFFSRLDKLKRKRSHAPTQQSKHLADKMHLFEETNCFRAKNKYPCIT